MGGTYLADGTLRETVSRASTSTAPFVSPRSCEHDQVVEGFAYVDQYRHHWPILVCRDCRTILAGRTAYFAERRRPIWQPSTEDDLAADLIVARWAKTWPKDGRPRARHHPAGIVWPEEQLDQAA